MNKMLRIGITVVFLVGIHLLLLYLAFTNPNEADSMIDLIAAFLSGVFTVIGVVIGAVGALVFKNLNVSPKIQGLLYLPIILIWFFLFGWISMIGIGLGQMIMGE